eukprot:scaffold7374_cov112-Isochrysis_galbana.AAC.5
MPSPEDRRAPGTTLIPRKPSSYCRPNAAPMCSSQTRNTARVCATSPTAGCWHCCAATANRTICVSPWSRCFGDLPFLSLGIRQL